jgi:cysteinyl-tRNA synthetase
MKNLKIYNSFSRELSDFTPIDPKGEYIGMYVCGPTVYNEVHLGNCRTFVTFDIVYRYLLAKGYKVRYVRNITDVGHLEGDVDSGAESKIDQRARLERLEPMEIVQKYTNLFHDVMRQMNTLPPSIEPTATGHIVEQIEMVKEIIGNGYGYEKNGSVYFNTKKLIEENKGYGTLSGKLMDDLISESRDNLKNQDEKEHPSDFAIWVKASPTHIMRWPSPWGVGFPGWHLECSAMSTKYLGQTFDIHGGGMDLQFPHHENEIAQNIGACGCQPVRYWMHGNMLILNGKKMSKSDGNSIMPREMFDGSSPLMTKAYSPMTLRFFMLQAHYRSTLNITDDAMQAAEKGLQRLMEANEILLKLKYSGAEALTELDGKINQLIDAAFADMDDDFNTPNALAKIFGLVSEIQKFQNALQPINSISQATFDRLKQSMSALIFDIFGLMDEGKTGEGSTDLVDGLMQMIVRFRKEARDNKEWAKSDLIRDELQKIGVQIKDGKEGATWGKI